jgi:hypothetical protein
LDEIRIKAAVSGHDFKITTLLFLLFPLFLLATDATCILAPARVTEK